MLDKITVFLCSTLILTNFSYADSAILIRSNCPKDLNSNLVCVTEECDDADCKIKIFDPKTKQTIPLPDLSSYPEIFYTLTTDKNGSVVFDASWKYLQLSDGTHWSFLKNAESIVSQWKANEKILVEYSKYWVGAFLYNVDRDERISATNDPFGTPKLTVQSIDDTNCTICLSDGKCWRCNPDTFISDKLASWLSPGARIIYARSLDMDLLNYPIYLLSYPGLTKGVAVLPK